MEPKTKHKKLWQIGNVNKKEGETFIIINNVLYLIFIGKPSEKIINRCIKHLTD